MTERANTFLCPKSEQTLVMASQRGYSSFGQLHSYAHNPVRWGVGVLGGVGAAAVWAPSALYAYTSVELRT